MSQMQVYKGNTVLNESHCACLDKVLQNAANGLALAQQCHDCGLDVAEVVDMLKAQQTLATKLKATFFPNKV